MPQLRQNIITGDWVVIAPERSKRPNDYATSSKKEIAIAKTSQECVFCPNGKEHKRRLRGFDSKNTWVIPNKYPAFIYDESQSSTRSFYPESSFFRAKAAVGEHDIVVIKDHLTDLPHFSLAVWRDLLETIQLRMLIHRQNQQVEHIMPIYNHLPEAGASIAHPHAQIFSPSVIPNIISSELEGAQRYFANNGFCVFCDLINHEIKEKVRIVDESKHFIVFAFYASRFPFETWILPKYHQSNFETTNKIQRSELALVMKNATMKFDKLLANPPLNWWIHSLPTIERDSDYYHWHIEIAPRVTGYGGFELGSGIVIDIQSPEEAAAYLRKIVN